MTEPLPSHLKAMHVSPKGGCEGKILQMHLVFKAYASEVITNVFGDCFHFLDKNFGYNFGSTELCDTCLRGILMLVTKLLCHFWLRGLIY